MPSYRPSAFPTAPRLRTGQRVCGDYEIAELVFAGRDWLAYVARRGTRRNTRFLVWTPRDRDPVIEALGVDDDTARALRRALAHRLQLVSKLQHPSLVPVVAYGVEVGTPIIVTQDDPGILLARVLESAPDGMRLGDVDELFQQIALGLDYLHGLENPIAHGAIDPTTISRLEGGTEIRIRQAGFAHALSHAASDARSGVVASMRPPPSAGANHSERARVRAADLRMVAALAFECLTGRNSQGREGDLRASAFRSRLSPHVDETLRRATLDASDEAFESVEAFAIDLSAALVRGDSVAPDRRIAPSGDRDERPNVESFVIPKAPRAPTFSPSQAPSSIHTMETPPDGFDANDAPAAPVGDDSVAASTIEEAALAASGASNGLEEGLAPATPTREASPNGSDIESSSTAPRDSKTNPASDRTHSGAPAPATSIPAVARSVPDATSAAPSGTGRSNGTLVASASAIAIATLAFVFVMKRHEPPATNRSAPTQASLAPSPPAPALAVPNATHTTPSEPSAIHEPTPSTNVVAAASPSDPQANGTTAPVPDELVLPRRRNVTPWPTVRDRERANFDLAQRIMTCEQTHRLPDRRVQIYVRYEGATGQPTAVLFGGIHPPQEPVRSCIVAAARAVAIAPFANESWSSPYSFDIAH